MEKPKTLQNMSKLFRQAFSDKKGKNYGLARDASGKIILPDEKSSTKVKTVAKG